MLEQALSFFTSTAWQITDLLKQKHRLSTHLYDLTCNIGEINNVFLIIFTISYNYYQYQQETKRNVLKP